MTHMRMTGFGGLLATLLASTVLLPAGGSPRPSGGVPPLVTAWEGGRRAETLNWFEANQFGKTPVGRLPDQTFEADAVVFTNSGIRIRITCVLPEGADAAHPAPVFLFGDHRGGEKPPHYPQETYEGIPTNAITARGYAYVRWNFNDVCPNASRYTRTLARWPLGIISYLATGNAADTNVVRAADGWGTIGAWAWGHSRVMDWIETRPELDAARVAVVGHSRGGKTALWTAAQDTRFAMAVSNGSGCGGARLGRAKDPKAETFRQILHTFPNWFCPAFTAWIDRDAEVPHDADDLIRLVAPRLVYVASGSEDAWAGPAAEKAAWEAAHDLYRAYGHEDRMGYHCHEGPHRIRPDDWERFMDFADRNLKKTVRAVPKPKYVFLFIGDGMSTPQRMVAEEFARTTGHGELVMNRLPYQANTRTKSANAIITDSAAAATAIACGEKTNNGMVGVRPDGSRLESVAEIAKRRGRKVGIATTVTVVHATPAGFYAHNKSRGASYQIARDLVASGFDYFCAGGVYDKANDTNDVAYAGNVYDLARAAGYRVVRNDLAAWRALTPGVKSWSVFGDHGMSFAIDANPNQPTPAEIVRKGIELLDNPNGFFFMFEGGKVDYAGHANDAATNLREVLALDEAVRVALAFRERHPDETLVITTGDHETGGMSMGFAGIGGQFRVGLLAGQKISVEKFSSDVKALIRRRKGEITFDEMRPALAEKFALKDLSESETRTLSEAFAKDVAYVRAGLADTTAHDVARRYVFAQAVKIVLNARAGVGWSSGSHTALPTFTTAVGVGAEMLLGMTENTDLGLRLKALLDR